MSTFTASVLYAMPSSHDCRHTGDLAARWDYLSQDDTCGTGWIVCRECLSMLERLTASGGRFHNTGGRFLGAFLAQIEGASYADLKELEVD
jgi:hypothetical protein